MKIKPSTWLEYSLIALIGYVIFFSFRLDTFIYSLAGWVCVRLFYHWDTKYDLRVGEGYKAMFAMGIWLSLGGFVFGLFQHFDYLYDKFLHMVLPFGITLIIYKIYQQKLITKQNMLLIISLMTVIALLTGFEFLEFGADKVLGTKLQGVFMTNGTMVMNPNDDTMLDLLFGSFGASVACFALHTFKKEKMR